MDYPNGVGIGSSNQQASPGIQREALNGRQAAQLPSQLIEWLYKVLQPQYTHMQVAYTQIIQMLQIYFSKGFRIRTRAYTSDRSGRSNLMINIFGNIDNVIPVEVWLPLGYPFSSPNQDDIDNGVPIVYVVPNNRNGLYLKPGNYVDSQGRFYHPFLTDWFTYCKSSDLNSTRGYNLITLLSTMTDVFHIESPIYQTSTPGAPGLPPKPSRVIDTQSTLTAQSTGSSSTSVHHTYDASPREGSLRASSTPNEVSPVLPSKVPNSNAGAIPSRYQKPLPLPSQMTSPTQLSSNLTGGTRDSSNWNSMGPSARFRYPKSPSPPTYFPPEAHSSHQITHQSASHRNSHRQNPSIDSYIETQQDLMDRDDRTGTATNDTVHIVESLNKEIMKHLGTSPSITNFDSINLNSRKIDKLYDQLAFHNTQASANKQNLQSHVDYLSDQLTSVRKLNGELQLLTDLNNRTPDMVYFTPEKGISLDELIVPDSVLTKQLYDTVAEIKANKDCLSLIKGEFSGAKEVINDNNFDDVVKQVRNIGRETFWLELTKLEIQNRMGIQDFSK